MDKLTGEQQQNSVPATAAAPFRIDQQLHQILYKEPARSRLEPKPEELLPEPVFPQHPNPTEMTRREYKTLGGLRPWTWWGKPYFKSRWRSGELRPIIPYL